MILNKWYFFFQSSIQVDSIGSKHEDIVEVIKAVTIDEEKMKEYELGEQNQTKSEVHEETSQPEESDELKSEPELQNLEKEVELYFSEKEIATSVENSEDEDTENPDSIEAPKKTKKKPVIVEETENSTEEPENSTEEPDSTSGNTQSPEEEESEVIIIRKKYEPTWIESALQAVVAPGISSRQVNALHVVFVALMSLILTWMYVIYMRKSRFQSDLLFHLGIFLAIAVILYGLTQWVLYKLDYLSPVNSEDDVKQKKKEQ
jgi:hypothetical protein